jgi:2-dehydro-3-deoxygluconokinase
LPSSALTIAATSSVKTAAPGLRITSAPSTPGSSHTPYISPCSGGRKAKALPVAAYSRFQAQKTTPKATAITAATTTSTVRQVLVAVSGRVPAPRELVVVMCSPSGVVDGRCCFEDRFPADDPTPCAGMTQIRFEGLRSPALSAPQRSPVVPCRATVPRGGGPGRVGPAASYARPMPDGPGRPASAPVEVVTLGEVMALMLAEGSAALSQAARFDLSVAGAEGNVAVGLARLGHSVAIWSCLGEDALGDVVLRSLRGEGLDVSGVRRVADRPTGLIVRDAPLGRPVTVGYYRGGSAGAALGPQDVLPEVIRGARLLHLTGITAMLSDSSHSAVLLAAEQARAAGVTVSVDPNLRLRLAPVEQWRERLDPLLRAADVVLTGRDELELLSGAADPRWLLDRGAGTVVVKDGAAGAYETDGRTELRAAGAQCAGGRPGRSGGRLRGRLAVRLAARGAGPAPAGRGGGGGRLRGVRTR